MSVDRHQGASSGPRYPAEPEPLAGLGPSGGYHSRMQWRPLLEAPQTGEVFLIASVEGTGPTFGAFQDGYFRLISNRHKVAGFGKWFWMPLPPAPCDERPTGPRPSGLGGDSPASAVANGEAPEQIISRLTRERDAYREALRPFADAVYEFEGLSQFESFRPLLSDWLRARTLLSQSSEGGEGK